MMTNKALLAVTVTPNTTNNSIPELISGIIEYVLLFVGGVLMLMIIYGGVLLITSGSDPDKVTKAKKTLLWAVIGVILIVISYSVVVALKDVVNNNIIF